MHLRFAMPFYKFKRIIEVSSICQILRMHFLPRYFHARDGWRHACHVCIGIEIAPGACMSSVNDIQPRWERHECFSPPTSVAPRSIHSVFVAACPAQGLDDIEQQR